MHKENVNEIKIEGTGPPIEKRKAFVSMFKEFKFSYALCKEIYTELLKTHPHVKLYSDEERTEEEKLLRLAYIYFYAGVGPSSNIMNREIAGAEFDIDLQNRIIHDIEKIKSMFGTSLFVNYRSKIINSEEISLSQHYKPFGGHVSRLGHYYRHLYQTAKFIVSQEEKFLNYKEKYSYIKTLRAQLSDHEQLMLYYNVLSGFGHNWLAKNHDGKNILTDYRFIRNMPLALTTFCVDPRVKFAKEIKEWFTKGKSLFEWMDYLIE